MDKIDREQPVGNREEMTLEELIAKLSKLKKYIYSSWKIILFTTIVGGSLGFLYAFLKKPVYIAECTFVLQDEKSSSLSQYSGLASIMGVGSLGGASNGLFSGDNIIDLYKSRLMIEKTLLTPAVFKNKNILLIDRYIDINQLRKKWANNLKLNNINFNIPQSSFTIAHDSILRDVVADINKNYLTVLKPDKKQPLIKVSANATDELFAKALAEKIVYNVNNFYIQTSTKKSLDNLKILQFQVDSIRGILNRSLGTTASAIDATPNANPAMQVLRVPMQKQQIDLQASTAIYTEAVKNLEIAKITLRKETPLIQVIDTPILPLEMDKVGKISATIVGGVMFFFIAVFCITLNKVYVSFKSNLS